MYTTFFYKLNNDGTANAEWFALGNKDEIFTPIKPSDFPEQLSALNQQDLDQQVQTMLINNQQCHLNTWAQLLVAHTKEPVDVDAVGLLSIITAVRIFELSKQLLEHNFEKESAAVKQQRDMLNGLLQNTSGAEHFQIQQEINNIQNPVLEIPFSTENLDFWSTWIRNQKIEINELPEKAAALFKNLETKHFIDAIKNIYHASGMMTFLNEIEETYDATMIGSSAKLEMLHTYSMTTQPPEGISYGVQTGTLTDIKIKEPIKTEDLDDVGSLLQQQDEETKEPPIPEEQKTNPRNIYISSVYFLNAFGELTIQSESKMMDSLEWFKERSLKYRANPKPDLNAVKDLVEQCLRYGTSKLELAEQELKTAQRPGGELAQDICAMLYNRPWLEVLGQIKAFDVLGSAIESEARELFKQARLHNNINKQLDVGTSVNSEEFEAGNLF